MIVSMEKSKNFRIDALLAHDAAHRTDRERASPGLFYSRSPDPASACASESTSPQTNPSSAQPGVLSKPSVFSLSQSGLGVLHQAGLIRTYPAESVNQLAALGSQPPALVYPSFTQLLQPFTEQMQGGTNLALEPWIRAGLVMPRLGEYGGEL